VPRQKLTQIYNGVDSDKFYPRVGKPMSVAPKGFLASDSFVIGTVGRMEPVKDQLTLVRAFINLVKENETWRKRLRLTVIGDGALREQGLRLLRDADVEQFAWLPGERSDIPDLMRSMDLFVLPSLREGVSNTILEAMASGLPVVATAVGGNLELVEQDKTGMLVAHSDVSAMANAIATYVSSPKMAAEHGCTGRAKVDACFSMKSMVDRYCGVYNAVLGRRSGECHEKRLNVLRNRPL
jgi:sugar transferase (PEP-CTERM/EpsH1 system associated)